MSKISLKNIRLNLGGKDILKNFSLDVRAGEKVLLYGKSGTGKTSIIRLVLGFVQADEGQVLFAGKDVTETITTVRTQTAYVPQDMDISDGSIAEFVTNVFSLKANAKLYEDPIAEFTLRLADFDLEQDILTKDMSEVSGGEKQRAVIIIAAMLDREVLLLDEPTASLDKALKHKIAKRIANSKKTTIIVSHDDIWLDMDNVTLINMEKDN